MCCIFYSKNLIGLNDLVEEVTCNSEVSSPLCSDSGHVPVCCCRCNKTSVINHSRSVLDPSLSPPPAFPTQVSCSVIIHSRFVHAKYIVIALWRTLAIHKHCCSAFIVCNFIRSVIILLRFAQCHCVGRLR